MRRSVRDLLLVLATFPALGCATAVGTVAGPVTTPISFFEHTKGTPQWAKVFAIPILLPLGVVLGFSVGAAADIGFVKNGEYGDPRFDTVFDPANPERKS